MRIPSLVAFSIPFLFASAQTYQYTLGWQNPRTHLYEVSLTTACESGKSTVFEIPAWRPGRYYIQDYAAAVTAFSAQDQAGKMLVWKKIDNHSWQVDNPNNGNITINYQYFANTMDAGSCMLEPGMAYFNPSNLFMHVRGRYDVPCTLQVTSMPETWKSATALKKSSGSHNLFSAVDYHDFVDAPTVLSPTLKTLQNRINGVDYYFHFQGAAPADQATENACLDNLGKIIREQEGIFGEMPFTEYHFIYHLLPFNIGHAVEHKYSSCYALPATLAQNPSAIARLNSITAHEFFHLWNVKRIRPAAMWPYDYQKEAYTTLQWFTEGVTDYYADLTLVRSGLITRDQFLNIMAKTIEALENSYAATVISCEQSSFDSWLERSDYQIPYHRISYYTLGTRAGLLLDLEIRRQTKGKFSMDDLFRKLYAEFYQQDRGLGEEDLPRVLKEMTGLNFEEFFFKYIRRADVIPYEQFFEPFGLQVNLEDKAGTTWEKVGIDKWQEAAGGLVITKVRPKSDIERAGLGEGDSILEINGKAANQFDAKEFFGLFKKSKTLKILTEGIDGKRELELEWTGSYSPKTCTIIPLERIKEEQNTMLDALLKSVAK